MKKILFAVMAVAAISFTSCGNKTEQAEAAQDSVAIVDSIANDAAGQTLVSLSSAIEAKDAGKLTEVLEACKAKIAEFLKQNPEVAKAYVVKVQDFLKQNADKIKEFVGNNAAAQSAVDALTSIDASSTVDNFISQIEGSAAEVKDAANQAAEDAKAAVEDAKDQAKQQVEDAKEAAKDAAKAKANEAIDNAAGNAKKALGL